MVRPCAYEEQWSHCTHPVLTSCIFCFIIKQTPAVAAPPAATVKFEGLTKSSRMKVKWTQLGLVFFLVLSLVMTGCFFWQYRLPKLLQGEARSYWMVHIKHQFFLPTIEKTCDFVGKIFLKRPKLMFPRLNVCFTQWILNISKRTSFYIQLLFVLFFILTPEFFPVFFLKDM